MPSSVALPGPGDLNRFGDVLGVVDVGDQIRHPKHIASKLGFSRR